MKHRFEVLDIFRGIFASTIFLFHLESFTDTIILRNKFVQNSYLFVDFFFVLSGFVIAQNYEKIKDLTSFSEFIKKRLLRIYPLHLLMLLVFIFIEVVKVYLAPYIHVNQPNNINNNIYSIFTNLLLLNSIKMFNITDVSWNIQSWSISAEMVAYIAFGLLSISIFKLKLIKYSVFAYLLASIISLILLYLIDGSLELHYTYDFGFLRAIFGFLVGCVCLKVYQLIKSNFENVKQITFTALESSILLTILFSIIYNEYLKNITPVFHILFFICILIFSFDKGMISTTLLKSMTLKNMGKYSYSIYMTHTVVISLFNIVFIRILKLPTSHYSYLFILNYFLVYQLSRWTYTNIEMRFMKPKISTAKSRKPF